MSQHQVADNRLRHLLGTLNRGLSMARGETLHFDDVATLRFQRRRHFVERILGILAQRRLSGLEADFGLRRSLVLIDVANYLLDIPSRVFAC